MILTLLLGIGLLLGPTFLNVIAFQKFALLFKSASGFFLFIAGLECSIHGLRKNLKVAAVIGAGAFVLPFALAYFFAPQLGLASFANRWILATALSVSALPVIIQILREQKLLQTRPGEIVIAAATLCDIAAWLCFLIVLPQSSHDSWIQSHYPILLFFLGMMVSSLLREENSWLRYLHKSNTWVFAPLFFIGVGAQMNLFESFNLSLALGTFFLSSATKILGAWVAARAMKVQHEEALIISLSLNARGAVEILLATLAHQSGLIDSVWLTNLVFMAVATSVIAGPIISLVRKKFAQTVNDKMLSYKA